MLTIAQTALTVAYLRVSTADQTTENQKREIAAAGFEPTLTFHDTVSGTVQASERAGFGAALGALRAAEGPRRLVVTKLDRLGRSTADVLDTIKALSKIGAEVIVLQLGKLDLTSSAGKLMLTMLSAVAEMERDLLVERTHAGLARARAEGRKGGRPAALDAAGREQARALIAAGQSMTAVAKVLGVSRQTIMRATEGART
jgi:DNA invertase Pin-like site-specific DNA recombinase